MVLVHSGIHFNAMLPCAATAFMMIVTASGHIGQYLVRKIREEVNIKKKQAGITDNTDDFPDQQHFWDSLTVNALDRWRTIHMPMVSVLLGLTLLHILSVIFFMNWR